jgi:IPT/TIG domain-containing protein
MRRLTYLALIILPVLVLAIVPSTAFAKRSKKPVITSVSPMRIKVGDSLTIRGRNFSSRRRKNTVIFAVGRRSFFVKPSRASRRKLRVQVPVSLERVMKSDGKGHRKATRFSLQVAAKKFGKRTGKRLSPVIVPIHGAPITVPGRGTGSGTGSGGGSTAPVCDTSNAGADNDHDLLSNGLEKTLGTDPCKADTDADGVQDGFEYESAIDLNNDEYQDPNSSMPYPGKRPYPNALDPTDGNTDYDGDSLSQKVEQSLWNYTVSKGAPRRLRPVGNEVTGLTYSDGEQYSVSVHHPGQGDHRFPNLLAAGYAKQQDFVNWASANGYRNIFINVHSGSKPAGLYGLFDINLNGTESAGELAYNDRNGDGFLSDDERDEDADGLTNYDENTGRLVPKWWDGCYSGEKGYYLHYAGTDPAAPDSDGDGVRDGADDQDHDDVPNVMELSRIAASGINDTEQNRECKLNKALADSFSGEDPPIYNHQAAYGRLNPFNPCLPDTSSRTCKRYVDFGSPWAPFDDSVDWVSLN